MGSKKRLKLWSSLVFQCRSHLEDGRLDALSYLVPYVDVPGHFCQDIGPEGRLLGSGPAEGRWVPGCVLQLRDAGVPPGLSPSGCACSGWEPTVLPLQTSAPERRKEGRNYCTERRGRGRSRAQGDCSHTARNHFSHTH